MGQMMMKPALPNGLPPGPVISLSRKGEDIEFLTQLAAEVLIDRILVPPWVDIGR